MTGVQTCALPILEKLGLEVDPDGPSDPDEMPDDPFDKDGRKTSPTTAAPSDGVVASPAQTDRIGVETAVVAPDATPGHDEPIPPSVLQALDVLQSPNTSAPVPDPTNGSSAPPVAAPANTATESKAPISVVMRNWRRASGNKTSKDATIVEDKPAAPAVASASAPSGGLPGGVGGFMNNLRKASKKAKELD